MKLFGIAPFIAVVTAFADTASFYSSADIGSGFDYITDVSKLSNAVQDYTSQLCKSDGQLTVYRVDAPFKVAKEGTYIKHVHYENAGQVDLSFGAGCEVSYAEKDSSASASILVVDVQTEDLEQIIASNSGAYFIQGKPTFGHSGSKLDSVKHYIEDSLDIDFKKKRSIEVEDGENDDELLKEVLQDFRDVDSFIREETTHEGDGELDPQSFSRAAASSAGPLATGLFTKYQFFTPGIWMGIIVSFVLVFVLYIALSWISALEISYHSFEKQVDFEKKHE